MSIFTRTCGATRHRQVTIHPAPGKKAQVIKTVQKCHLPKGHKGGHQFT